MAAYYNEFDQKTAAWLRELIKQGLIVDGEVDERSIVDVEAKDLLGFKQHHFFAGIGGWSFALRISGWPDDTPVWTASLPCQPFSSAGKGLGKSDERHLLPHFIDLVKQCKPSTIFGEQVPGAIKHGWLDDLCAEMEARDYSVGSVIAGAHSIGAAHIRQRLYWVANNGGARCEEQPGKRRVSRKTNGYESRENITGSCRMGISDSSGSQQGIEATEATRYGNTTESAGCDDIQWIYCRDNKYRPVKSGILPLAHGIPKGMVYSDDSCAPTNEDSTQEARVARIKGYGNAIVPQLAAEFIGSFMDVVGTSKLEGAR